MNKYLGKLVMYAPPAHLLYPILGLFLLACIIHGAWVEGLERAVISSAEAKGTLSAIIRYATPEEQLKALGDMNI